MDPSINTSILAATSKAKPPSDQKPINAVISLRNSGVMNFQSGFQCHSPSQFRYRIIPAVTQNECSIMPHKATSRPIQFFQTQIISNGRTSFCEKSSRMDGTTIRLKLEE